MRGGDDKQLAMLTLRTPDKAVPPNHPLRRIKAMADKALAELSPTFDVMYSKVGRSSIPPERLLKAMLLMAFYSVRSERLLCEQLGYNLLFLWFLDMNNDEEPFDHSVFSKNRDRLLEHDVAGKFLNLVIRRAKAEGLISAEHFTVDGTLIEAWASLKSFKKKDEKPDDQPPPDDRGNPTVNFHGEKRGNETHASTTDPESRLARKGDGKESKLAFSAHALMENRNGLVVGFSVDKATGHAERWNALELLNDALPGNRRITLGADKGYDTADFVGGCRALGVTPHIARNTKRSGGSALEERWSRSPGYEVSQRKRKLVEEIFGWMKTIGGFRKTRFRGVQRTGMAGTIVAAAYNLLRMGKLLEPAGGLA